MITTTQKRYRLKTSTVMKTTKFALALALAYTERTDAKPQGKRDMESTGDTSLRGGDPANKAIKRELQTDPYDGYNYPALFQDTPYQGGCVDSTGEEYPYIHHQFSDSHVSTFELCAQFCGVEKAISLGLVGIGNSPELGGHCYCYFDTDELAECEHLYTWHMYDGAVATIPSGIPKLSSYELGTSEIDVSGSGVGPVEGGDSDVGSSADYCFPLKPVEISNLVRYYEDPSNGECLDSNGNEYSRTAIYWEFLSNEDLDVEDYPALCADYCRSDDLLNGYQLGMSYNDVKCFCLYEAGNLPSDLDIQETTVAKSGSGPIVGGNGSVGTYCYPSLRDMNVFFWVDTDYQFDVVSQKSVVWNADKTVKYSTIESDEYISGSSANAVMHKHILPSDTGYLLKLTSDFDNGERKSRLFEMKANSFENFCFQHSGSFLRIRQVDGGSYSKDVIWSNFYWDSVNEYGYDFACASIDSYTPDETESIA